MSFWALNYINIKNLHLNLKLFHNFSCSYIYEIYPRFTSTWISGKYIYVCVTCCGLFVGHSFIIVFRSLHLLKLARCIRSQGDSEARIAAPLTLIILLKGFMIQVNEIFVNLSKYQFSFHFIVFLFCSVLR